MAKYKGKYDVNAMYRLYPVTLPLEAVGGLVEDVEVEGIIYRLHRFTDVGTHSFNVTFIPGSGVNIDFLVVAGGGSGGNHNTTNANGGGGGGGVLYKTAHPMTLGNFPIMVGAGGAAIANATALPGNNGENSYFGDYVAIGGGGGGGGNSTNNAKDGGCGGGFGRLNTYHAAALQTSVLDAAGYGNVGGLSTVNYTGAGGGGAGSIGENGNSSSPGGNGGQGFLCSITGEEVGYAGGGGGGGNSSERAGDGFHGGGRGCGTTSYYSHSTYTDEINATTKGRGIPTAVPNSGGGGGAGSYWASNGGWASGSGAGGSGVVIIRYPIGTA